MAAKQERANIIQLTKEEWATLLDGEIARLGFNNPREYFEAKDAGEIGCDTPEVPDIEMMLALGGETARQDLLSLLEKSET